MTKLVKKVFLVFVLIYPLLITTSFSSGLTSPIFSDLDTSSAGKAPPQDGSLTEQEAARANQIFSQLSDSHLASERTNTLTLFLNINEFCVKTVKEMVKDTHYYVNLHRNWSGRIKVIGSLVFWAGVALSSIDQVFLQSCEGLDWIGKSGFISVVAGGLIFKAGSVSEGIFRTKLQELFTLRGRSAELIAIQDKTINKRQNAGTWIEPEPYSIPKQTVEEQFDKNEVFLEPNEHDVPLESVVVQRSPSKGKEEEE